MEIFKELIGRPKPKNEKIHELELGTVKTSESSEIANLFAETFTIPHVMKPTEHELCPGNITQITELEVELAFKKTKPCNQPELPFQKLKPLLCSIYNSCLNTGTFLQIFKHAVINPVYKGKGSRSEPLSYRPISTLPFFAKLFEEIIARRISEESRISSL